jgi:Peptidase family C25
MKRIFTIVLLLLSIGLAAQTYNNEWIDYSKTYYKFKVGATGLYRIPQSVLSGAGLGSVPAQNFQLFRNGTEVPVFTSVPSGPLGGSDYIEFWGLINDGAPDAPLYRVPASQHTQKWSLETDTAVYFLTVNTTGNTFHYLPTNNDPTGTTLPLEPYFMYTAGNYFKSGGINPGYAQVVGEYIYSSSYDIGEFWASPFVVPGSPLPDNQANLQVYGAGPQATLKFGMTGCADNIRSVQVTLNSSLLADTVMNSFNDLLTTRPVPVSLINSGSAALQFINNSANTTDRMVVSFYELNYPRQFNFNGQSNFSFQLPARASGFYLNITNFNVSGSASPVLYDMTNGLRYTAVIGGGNTLSFILGGSGSSRNLVLVNEDPSTVSSVGGFTAKNFQNFTTAANQGNYLIISNPILYTGTHGNNPVTDYKTYRSSGPGGGFDVQVYDINELVDQFGFGIKKHPLSIQNFLRYARAVFATKPQYVFLIGHGMTYPDYNTYSEINHDPLADKLNLVPTYGYPASDNKLSAANPVDPPPVTPIGRLSVISGAEIETYTQKMQEYEQAQQTAPNTIAGRLWMKNVLHLTGVSEPYLGTILCNYMYSYQQTIVDTSCGDNVYTFCDGNAGNVTQISGNVIPSLFATGFSILNYFGHSSNTTLAYNLNNPQDYNNQGKYPVFFINGCDAGDFFVYDNLRFTTSETLSETYVLAKERGAMAFVAATHFGIVNYLNILLNGLYTLIDGADYGKSLGIIQKDALQNLVNTAPSDYFARLHAEEMTTHGDPAMKLNQESLPDYDIEASQVLVNPALVSVSNTNFTYTAHFFNLGKAVNDSIFVLVRRQYPDGTSTILLNKKIKGIYYSDSIQIVIPIISTRDKGQNIITVTINSTNNVPEITLANNSVSTPVYIYQNAATPVYPYNFAIVNNNRQKLVASTDNPLSPIQQYVMEIDTTTLFNSPLEVSKNLSSVGGELEFDPGITYRDSLVYYWRVSVVPATGGVYTWNNASFVYIDSISSGPGMNQSHFYQHTQSTPNNMRLDSASRTWIFDSVVNNLYVRIGSWVTSAVQETQVSIVVNGGIYFMHNACEFSSLIFNVFDPVTFRPWLNTTTGGVGLYGSAANNCTAGREYSFEFRYTDTASRRTIMNFMDNIIPAGAYVAVRSFLVDPATFPTFPQAYAVDWHADTVLLGAGNSLYNRLLTQGFAAVDSFSYPRNFAFIYKKNQPGVFRPQWLFTTGVTDNQSVSININTPDTSATLSSPNFGPAKKWSQLHWRGRSLESPSADVQSVQVIGIDTLGNQTPLLNLGVANQDYDISAISATKYPYLQLKLNTSDTVTGTPYQLNYWRLNYTPVPEGALAPNIYLSGKDSLNIGETLNFGVAFKNVSPYPFDSMLVHLNIIDKGNVTHNILLPKKKPMISGDTVTLNYQLNTQSYPGLNTAYVEFNPNNNQPEQYHFNNFMYKTFYVNYDSRNPLLDVTFDNVHILNDDIVSSKPHIQIKLKSQSQFVLLTDTSLITVQVRFPDGSMHNYGFNTDTLRFTPATSGNNNVATVDFTPAFLTQYNASGDEYQLIVTGKDPLGNTAGNIPYRIGFLVITKAMISNMLNYPNPFTTSTAFVFTITGSDVPQNIKIQILTITGKIVREITKEELGPLHVGRNITEFKWNGTDMYGQRLANGVYLYHVVTNLNGKTLDKYQAAGDNTNKYFNNGYGKMYLMR